MVAICNDCTRLYEQLHQQEYEMFGLKRRITQLRSELKKERREKEKILKDIRQKTAPRLRKGQKRSRHGFH
jgi:hypothetical protein